MENAMTRRQDLFALLILATLGALLAMTGRESLNAIPEPPPATAQARLGR